jgi:flagellar motor switch protein FliN/FliY
MSKNSNTVEPHNVLSYIEEAVCEEWKKLLNAAFESTLFTATRCTAPAAPEGSEWFGYDFVPVQFGSVYFGSDHSTAVALGRRLLEAKRRTSEHEHHALHATGHLMKQLAESVSKNLSGRLSLQLECQESSTSNPESVASLETFAVQFSEGENRTHLLRYAVVPATAIDVREASSSASMSALPSRPGPTPAQNLDLLLDLEMPVTISFGATRLPLNEIAKLTTGSVVELNRTVAEPVDVVVNNRSIARGEVVVVEGNFAVRIKQVLSRQDRLQSLS